MKKKITREQRITKALVLHAYSLNSTGLLNGKMGLVLYFFHLGRVENNEIFTRFAEELLDNVIKSIPERILIDFEEGITGIGWAIENLIQNGFIDSDADEVLENFDLAVNNTLIHRKNDILTIISIGIYYVSRLAYRIDEEEKETVLDLKYHTILLIDELDRHFFTMKETLSDNVIYLLKELYKLNIFNYKIERLLHSVTDARNIHYLIPMIPKLNETEIDVIFLSTDIKSKYAGFDMKNIPENERWGLKKGIAGIGLQKIMYQHGK